MRGTWSNITNTSDRDTAISLLRSAGHGHVLDRNVDLILSSRVKIDAHGNIVELSLGQQDQSRTRFRQQQLQRRRRPAEGNANAQDNDNVTLYWELPASVGQLRNLNKLVLYRCGSIPSTLHDLPELECLALRFCDGSSMLQRRYSMNPPDDTTRTNNILLNIDGGRLSNLKMLEILDGVWDPKSIFWMKCMTATTADVVFPIVGDQEYSVETIQRFSQLETIRFSSLQNELRDAILNFLSPLEMGETESSYVGTHKDEGEKRMSRTLNLSTSKLKHLTWVHSGLTEQGLELLLRTVVFPHHPNLSSIDISGNKIRSIQFLFDICKDGIYPTISQQDIGEIIYHPLRTLNFEHNPVLRHRISNHHEVEAFELLLLHCFPLLGSLTPRWESWDARIEYLLRINRGGRVLVEGNPVPPVSSKSRKPTSNSDTKHRAPIGEVDLSEGLMRKKIHLAVWPLVLQRAYKTSAMGFMPRIEDATALYYLLRNGPALSEIFATDPK